MSTSGPLTRVCTLATTRHTNSLLPLTSRRHESTTRRLKKLLHVPESPSYTPSTPTPTLIFNPPSSSPNVYHTPTKFLPLNDKRKQLYAAALQYSTHNALRTSTPTTSTPGTPLQTEALMPPRPSATLPPPVRAPYEKKYHLTEKNIAQIRRLRAHDPQTWTRVKLAEKYGCSQFFIGMIAKNVEQAKKVQKEHEDNRQRWGTRRRTAREDRGRRKELWGRDA